MTRFGRIVIVVVFVLASINPAFSDETEASICQEFEDVIVHPADGQWEKVKRDGISCLVFPHCCSPAWVLSPDCYFKNWVTTGEPWEEIVPYWTCEDYSLTREEAFWKWIQSLSNPLTEVGIIPGDLFDIFALYVAAAYEIAAPIPDDMKHELRHVVNEGECNFTEQNIESARWLSASHAMARRIWPGGDVLAITYYNLIIVSEELLERTGCAAVSRPWAHELAHVFQYEAMGTDLFLETYLAQGLVRDWEDISQEQTALECDANALAACFTRPTITAVGTSTHPARTAAFAELVDKSKDEWEASLAEQDSIKKFFDEMIRSGAIINEGGKPDGKVLWMSSDAFVELQKKFPGIKWVSPDLMPRGREMRPRRIPIHERIKSLRKPTKKKQ